MIDGGYLVDHLMVCLANPDIKREEEMYNDEDKQVPLPLQKAPYSQPLFIFHCSFVGLLGGMQRRRRQVRLFQKLEVNSFSAMTHRKQPYLKQPHSLFGGKHLVAEFLIAAVGLDSSWFKHVNVEAVAQRFRLNRSRYTSVGWLSQSVRYAVTG